MRRTTDFEALWGAVLAAPLDTAPRLILADWLREYGDDPPLEAALRTTALAVADLRCNYRQPTRRSRYLLSALRVIGEPLLERKTMSLTYTNGGTYKARIVKWGLSESKEKKTPQVFFQVSILAEIGDKGEEFDCPSYERTIYRAITDNTVGRLVDDIARLGVELSSFKQLDPESPDAVSFDGIEVQVKCKHESYNGKTNERFDFNFGGAAPAPMDKSGVGRLDALFGSRLKPAAKANPTPAKTVTKTATKAPQTATEKAAEEVF